jgi:sugar lactone lactonase YvrE
VDAIGRVFVADTGNHRVRRIELDGTVQTVAGTGTPGVAGDGGQAIEAQLSRPAAVALDASGALFIADAGNFRVRRVGVDGVISTLTGGARPGTSGDGGPARDALLTEPTGLTLDDRGRLYIADAPAHRVRVIEPDGVIQTLAGTGAEGRGGDGGPATAASVGFPQRVVLDAAGRLLITQLQDGVVRRVSTDGTIATLAGAPESGVVDTRPGAQAPIDAPIGLAADRAGNVYVVESGAGTIIRIGPDGLLTVIAGNPIGQGRSGDAARDVPLFTAVDVALAADGTAYVLEARGTIWRLGRPVDGSPTEPSAEVTASSSPRPTIPPAADEFAEIESITLALRLDAGQAALDPTLEFHPGERVNISIEFANVKEGSRLGIRWSAGDRALGTFLTDPQSGYGRATFGFFFNLGTSAAIGPWKVEVLVGTRVAGVAEFVVTPGEVRVQPPQG